MSSSQAGPLPNSQVSAQETPLWTEDHVEGEVHEFMESTFASRYTAEPIKKSEFPKHGAPANVVYQLIKDLRTLDATPRLNLASFVTTWMEPEAEKLMMESLDVNYVDTEEYPSTTEIQNRDPTLLYAQFFQWLGKAVNGISGLGQSFSAPQLLEHASLTLCVEMLAQLYNSPAPKGNSVGTATVGSSEAIMLGALALKKRWQQMPRMNTRDKKDKVQKPNLVMGAEVHVCWEKFCRYFDVEQRIVYAEEGRYSATPELIEPLIDENTIGVVAVLGSTYTGEFEDVDALDSMISAVNERTGWDVAIHIDGASGAFVAPFLYPDLKWDFRLKNVASINISGHKYGLVYPGLGWIIWRNEDYLPEDLVFYSNYLGTVERSITLNFSKGASNIIAQYYQFLRLGFNGYAKIMKNLSIIKKRLATQIEATGHFEILSKDVGVPLVAFRLKMLMGSDGKMHHRLYTEYDVADRLRMKGWVLPAYTMPPNAEAVRLLRVTIREDFSMQMVDQLIADMQQALVWLDNHYTFTTEQVKQITHKLAGRQLSRLDTSLLSDDTKQPIKPC